jgi:hypothetical protein
MNVPSRKNAGWIRFTVHAASCYPAAMSTSHNKDEILQKLERNARPVAEITSYSGLRGIYGFFLLKGCLCIGRQEFAAQNDALLYVGKTESSQRERDAAQHLADSGTGHSTLRRSLGALLREELDLKPQPRSDSENSKRRFTHFKFDAAGEERLTAWMKNHLGLGFCQLPDLTIHEMRDREKKIIKSAMPALNIMHNSGCPYFVDLKLARKHCAGLAERASRR